MKCRPHAQTNGERRVLRPYTRVTPSSLLLQRLYAEYAHLNKAIEHLELVVRMRARRLSQTGTSDLPEDAL